VRKKTDTGHHAVATLYYGVPSADRRVLKNYNIRHHKLYSSSTSMPKLFISLTELLIVYGPASTRYKKKLLGHQTGRVFEMEVFFT
jgi:hypothetical protein